MNQTTVTVQQRIASIDVMRGMVILLMMLDHVRQRFFMHTRTGDPIFDTVEPDLFFTRFATHFCAPIFIFLAGVSAWLYAHPDGKSARGVVLTLVMYPLVNAFGAYKHKYKHQKPWLSYF